MNINGRRCVPEALAQARSITLSLAFLKFAARVLPATFKDEDSKMKKESCATVTQFHLHCKSGPVLIPNSLLAFEAPHEKGQQQKDQQQDLTSQCCVLDAMAKVEFS